jgi:hypothetical protein
MKKNTLLNFFSLIPAILLSTNSFGQQNNDTTLSKKVAVLESKVINQQNQINQLKNKSLFEMSVGIDRRGSKQPIFPKK